MINNKKQKNVMLSILLMLLFSYPIITIFNKVGFVKYVPVLYLYVAVVWVFALLLLFISAEVKPFKKTKKNEDG